MPSILLIILLVVFLLLSGLFSLSETAVLSSNRYRIGHLAAGREQTSSEAGRMA